MSDRTVVGLDLGGTKLAGAVFDGEGNVLARRTAQVEGRGGDEVGRLAAAETRFLLEAAASLGKPAGAVGVSVPGIFRRASGTVWAPNIPGWEDYPLERVLSEASDGLPVLIDNDRACYILGETWRGHAAGARHAVFLAVGTGIGAGILVDGAILRGRSDIAGAIGWFALDRPFRPGYPEHGCFEYAASGPGLVRYATDLLATGGFDMSRLTGLPSDQWSASDILEAAQAGDLLGTAVVDNAIGLWGMTAANLVSLFNPEVIIFGGGVFGPAVRYLDRIRSEAERWAQPIAMKEVRIAGSLLGGDAGLFGAGRLALGAGGPVQQPATGSP